MIQADKGWMKLSMHFRGPTWLKQLAIYYPNAGSNAKRSTAIDKVHGHRHGHQHMHHAKRDHVLAQPLVKERAVGDMVTATIDGKVVHWVNEYAGPGVSPSTATSHPPASEVSSACPYCSVQTTLTTFIGPSSQSPTTSAKTSAATGASPDSSPINPLPVTGGSSDSAGSWSRQAYYNADSGSSDGFTFLNHFGGTQGMPGTADGGPA